MGDLVPNLWDQLDFSSPKSNYDMMQEFNSQLKRQVTSRNVQFWFSIIRKIKWDASRWSFGPISAWGSIETMTIGTTHPTLYLLKCMSHTVWGLKLNQKSPNQALVPDIKQEYVHNSVTPITAPIKKEKSKRPPPLNLDYLSSFDSFSSSNETSPEAEQEVPSYHRYVFRPGVPARVPVRVLSWGHSTLQNNLARILPMIVSSMEKSLTPQINRINQLVAKIRIHRSLHHELAPNSITLSH